MNTNRSSYSLGAALGSALVLALCAPAFAADIYDGGLKGGYDVPPPSENRGIYIKGYIGQANPDVGGMWNEVYDAGGFAVVHNDIKSSPLFGFGVGWQARHWLRFDGTIDAQKAMSAILRTGERFGVEHLVALLRGERTENILKFNHDRLPTFGVGSGRKAGEWRSIFRQLSAVGLIAQDLMEHGRWWVTDEGWRVLKGETRIELRKDLSSGAAKGKAGARRDRRAATAAIVGEGDTPLLDALKALRTKLARTQNVPAYVVFSDRTLAELASHRPANPGAMREIHGIGDAKLERYGAAFLEVIRANV